MADAVSDLEGGEPVACKINGVSCGNVGKGFYQVFLSDIAQVRAAAEPYIKKGYRVLITGHSLGGATCTLAAFYFATAFPANKPTLITFASPKVGNNAWVSAFGNVMRGQVVRKFATKWKTLGITIYDVVTTVPPYFAHVAGEEIIVDCPYGNPIACHKLGGYIDGIQAANKL